ncbi:MAG: CpXC domain-containing protein [Spirochaetes bacterium]|nr:CpXC domain-containing protein [Spirochaetota bacterium]
MKVIVPCHCGHQFDYEYDDEVEITPDIYNDIVHGNFMSVPCEKCGITLKPEFSVMFTHPVKQMKILLVPELQRDSFLMGKSPLVYKKTDRAVIGFMELAEKLKILEAGFDDIVVECVKYYILSKIVNESNLETEIFIFFDELENNKLSYHIHGLKKDEVGVLNIDMEFYNMTCEKLKDTINEEPYKIFLTPPYISILKLYREYNNEAE